MARTSTKKKAAPRKSAKRKAGRPKTTGAGTPLMVRVQKIQLRELDAWIGKTTLSRPEAVRQLIGWALSQARRASPPPPSDPPLNMVRRARDNERRTA